MFTMLYVEVTICLNCCITVVLVGLYIIRNKLLKLNYSGKNIIYVKI